MLAEQETFLFQFNTQIFKTKRKSQKRYQNCKKSSAFNETLCNRAYI